MGDFTIKNGDDVESTVTGFRGKVTSRADHLHGSDRYYVQPPVDSCGLHRDGRWCDEDELKAAGVAVALGFGDAAQPNVDVTPPDFSTQTNEDGH